MAACTAFVGPVKATASDALPMRFTKSVPGGPVTANVMCPPLGVFSEGVITENSADEFQQALRRLRVDVPNAQPDVFFDSPGGSLAGAVRLGAAIRRLGLRTRLYSSYDRAVKDPDGVLSTLVEYRPDVVCASARP